MQNYPACKELTPMSTRLSHLTAKGIVSKTFKKIQICSDSRKLKWLRVNMVFHISFMYFCIKTPFVYSLKSAFASWVTGAVWSEALLSTYTYDAQRSKNGPYAICGQRRYRSACASVQSNLGISCLLTDTKVSIDSVSRQCRPECAGWSGHVLFTNCMRALFICCTSYAINRHVFMLLLTFSLNFQNEILFVLRFLRPSQPNGVMSSMINLPNHTFTGQA